MASQFPATGVDSFVTKVDNVDYPTAAMFNDLQDAVVNTQTKVGIDSSADTDSVDYKIANMWKAIYPIGCIYQSIVSTSPDTLFGGTWVAFGAGRVLVGINASDAEFDTVEETYGEKTHILTTPEMPSHAHTISASNSNSTNANRYQRGGSEAGTDSVNSVGGGGAHNNIQPSIVIYRWKRTA